MRTLILLFLCIPVFGVELLNTSYTFGTAETLQLGRPNRTGVPSKWSVAKIFSGTINQASSYAVKTFVITPGAAQFVQVSLDDSKGLFFTSAYLDHFDAALSVTGPFLGDQGASGNPGGNPGYFQVFVPYGHSVVLAVHEVNPGGGANASFHLLVEGFGDVQYSPPYALSPDLTVSVTHAGPFISGLDGFTYNVMVRNIGTAFTSGTMTLSDVLPVGMSVTSMAGPGWTCTLATVSCVIDNPIGPGAGQSQLTVTVSVSASAVSPLINRVTVSGGGDQVASNNSAGDVTTISPPHAPFKQRFPPIRN